MGLALFHDYCDNNCYVRTFPQLLYAPFPARLAAALSFHVGDSRDRPKSRVGGLKSLWQKYSRTERLPIPNLYYEWFCA